MSSRRCSRFHDLNLHFLVEELPAPLLYLGHVAGLRGAALFWLQKQNKCLSHDLQRAMQATKHAMDVWKVQERQ